jgi:uncharacterized protein YjbJ (UPF0337 family)
VIITLIVIATLAIILRLRKGKGLFIKSKEKNKTEVIGDWDKQKSQLKQRFAILTDNDLMFVKGKKEEMFVRIQVKLGKTKEELKNIIASL